METFVDSQQIAFTKILPFYLAHRFSFPSISPVVLISRCLALAFTILKLSFILLVPDHSVVPAGTPSL